MISISALDCFDLLAGRLTCSRCDRTDPWQVLVPSDRGQNLAELVYVAAAHLDQGHYRVGES